MECFEVLPTPFSDDDSMPPDWGLAEWARDHHDAQMRFGRPVRIGPKLKGWFERTGFVDVQERVIKAPIGPWAKDPRLKQLGFLYEHNYREGIGAWTTQVFKEAFGWSRSEIEVYLANVRKSMDNRAVHAYNRHYVVTGRKPFPHELLDRKPVAAAVAAPVQPVQPVHPVPLASLNQQATGAATTYSSTLGSSPSASDSPSSRPATKPRPSTAGAASRSG